MNCFNCYNGILIEVEHEKHNTFYYQKISLWVCDKCGISKSKER